MHVTTVRLRSLLSLWSSITESSLRSKGVCVNRTTIFFEGYNEEAIARKQCDHQPSFCGQQCGESASAKLLARRFRLSQCELFEPPEVFLLKERTKRAGSSIRASHGTSGHAEHFATLGLSAAASKQEIKTAYRKLALQVNYILVHIFVAQMRRILLLYDELKHSTMFSVVADISYLQSITMLTL